MLASHLAERADRFKSFLESADLAVGCVPDASSPPGRAQQAGISCKICQPSSESEEGMFRAGSLPAFRRSTDPFSSDCSGNGMITDVSCLFNSVTQLASVDVPTMYQVQTLCSKAKRPVACKTEFLPVSLTPAGPVPSKPPGRSNSDRVQTASSGSAEFSRGASPRCSSLTRRHLWWSIARNISQVINRFQLIQV
jgi:hypothetical protein